ncbi:hypothetical protein B0T16DRAFT_137183 [Cercophora newfieldiana]|uniref:Uncharacterized protein n=1 Tax=Cercophora newfieldiana TaxID=92897 RepID=A0AA39YF29_9PEZI|nr:hypothetical protein B0T16DRAFT_137183 [Cercophora newfieldiana]
MKWAAFTLLSALHITLAQKWKILGADRFETDEGIENLHGDIVTAVKQAFVLAETAFEVLNNNFNDPKVQSMVHHILGDGERLGTNLVQVQNYFNGVLQYQKEESTAPTEEFNRDTDLVCSHARL